MAAVVGAVVVVVIVEGTNVRSTCVGKIVVEAILPGAVVETAGVFHKTI